MTTYDYNFETYADLIRTLLDQISRLPPPLRTRLEKELDELLRLVEDIRSPRFMLIGRRGAGKSSLVNAIFNSPVAKLGAVEAQTGKPQWYECERDGKTIEILDTRGILEGGKPDEEDSSETPQASILDAVREKCPDIILFLCKATEVDSAIRESLDIVEDVVGKIERIHEYNPPVVGILTQCDQLAPADIIKLPTDDDEKNQNITQAVNVLTRHLESRETLHDNFVKVVPTAAFVRFRQKDGTPDENRDLRWNNFHEIIMESFSRL
jgi:predicted GTPase